MVDTTEFWVNDDEVYRDPSDLSTRIGDRTHGATLSECEGWAREARELENMIIEMAFDLEKLRKTLNEALTRLSEPDDYQARDWHYEAQALLEE